MDDTGPVSNGAWIGIALGAVTGLIAALWKLFGKSTEKGESQNARDIARVEKRLDDHIAEDIKVHERVVKAETHLEVANREIDGLRVKTTNIRHDILGEVTKQIMSWYKEVIDLVQKKSP